MRLLLDEHLSSKALCGPLHRRGHDVLAIDSHDGLRGSEDALVLEIASAEGRILVTCNVRDFANLTRSWLEVGREHAGCVLLVRVRPDQVGRILKALDGAFRQRTCQEDWCNASAWVSGADEHRA